jgi:membrane protein
MKDFTLSVKTFIDFIQTGIWNVRLKQLNSRTRTLVLSLRICSVTIRKYITDECSLKSSALTFYSLMSIVPVAAVAFAIAKGFGFQKLFEQRLLENAAGHEEVVAQVIEFSRRLLENTKSGVLAGVGVIVLIWSVIKVLDNIEQAFNDIWEVKKSRSFGRKFSDYLSVMLVAPVLLIISGSATVLVTTQITLITQKLGLGILSLFAAILIGFLPYCLIWLLFAFMYMFLPNTRIRISSGLIAGVAAGTLFEILQKFYIYFQVGVANYNAIYGSFAALPLFLVWLQLSWLIVLFGAELSFAHQNAESYELELNLNKYSRSLKNLISLAITHLIIKNFITGTKAQSTMDISNHLELPVNLVENTLADLCETGIIIEIPPEENHVHGYSIYQPARDVNTITTASVIEALEDRGIRTLPLLPETEEIMKLSEILKEFRQALDKSPVNILVQEI